MDYVVMSGKKYIFDIQYFNTSSSVIPIQTIIITLSHHTGPNEEYLFNVE